MLIYIISCMYFKYKFWTPVLFFQIKMSDVEEEMRHLASHSLLLNDLDDGKFVYVCVMFVIFCVSCDVYTCMFVSLRVSLCVYYNT